ncbi:MAG: M20/M25/M40 family metallo-hydrolase [Saprospirales bacterium]|nr:M20/M25/M40 family metallo-hydrolase [Saprospirales bacterium]MBK8493024.1 M20/M25/M40 family metallo-hydrolase [Saprospirales bacterium]
MKSFFRLLFRSLLIGLLGLITLLVAKTIMFSSRQIAVEPIQPLQIPEGASARLSTSLQIPSLAGSEGAVFARLDTLLRAQFPRAFSQLQVEQIGQGSLLLKWPGKQAKLNPILFMGHLDVVPADSAHWIYPPFAGTIADGFIWGRGAIDDKMSVWAILEAIEWMISEEYYPDRTLYLAFGHDEESQGKDGARQIGQWLASRDVRLDFVLDEGSFVVSNALDGLEAPLAAVAIGEKGFVSFTLKIDLAEGGHASMPPSFTAVGAMAYALERIRQHPFPASMGGVTGQFFDYVGPEIGGFNRVVLANRWLFSSLLIDKLSADPAANALIRTTAAPTLIQGGIRDNVLPLQVEATVNVRILPGETIASAQAYLEKIIDNPAIKISVADNNYGGDPPAPSSTEAFGFQVLQKTIGEIFPEAVVAPTVSAGFTDSRHYRAVSGQIYRFSPILLSKEDLKGMHGVNERISEENYARMIRFYRQLIRNACQ